MPEIRILVNGEQWTVPSDGHDGATVDELQAELECCLFRAAQLQALLNYRRAEVRVDELTITASDDDLI